MQSNLDMLSHATLIAIIADLNKALEKAVIDCASAQADADDYYIEITDIRAELSEVKVKMLDLSYLVDQRDKEINLLKTKYEPTLGIFEALERVAKEYPLDIRKDRKIGMIKTFRELTGLGLKDANMAINGRFFTNVES